MNPFKSNYTIIFLVTLGLVAATILLFIAKDMGVCGRDSKKEQIIFEDSGLLGDQRIKYQCWGKMDQVTGIILHYTSTKDFQQALEVMEKQELFVQIMIDKDGKAYQLTDNLDDFSAGATGGNAWGINIEIVGNSSTLKKSASEKDAQFIAVIDTIKYLSNRYNIPITNKLPASNTLIWHGIFSHQQVDKYHPNGGRRNKKDPGKDYMEAVMKELQSTG